MACTVLPVRALASSLDHDVKVRKMILIYYKICQQDPFHQTLSLYVGGLERSMNLQTSVLPAAFSHCR